MTDTTETARQYAERDHEALDVIGGHYSRHVAAMTAEGLHAKSDIAAELAYRDAVIESMRADAEIGRAWLKDSSLDLWFPYTASELHRLRDEHAKLLGFVREVMDCWPDGGMDGFELQEMAEKHGILIPETVTEPCCEDCACSSDAEFPTQCYRLADFVRNENGS